MTGSIAVWCKTSGNQAKPTEYEVHANYWRLASNGMRGNAQSEDATDLIEIGVKVVNINLINEVKIWVPFDLKRDQIEDCSKHFDKTDIAQGIFNEVMSVSVPGATGAHCIELSGSGTVVCRVHKFTTSGQELDDSELNVVNLAGGTLLTVTDSALKIARSAAEPIADTYFRLRMPIASGENLVTRIEPSDKMLLSGYDVVEYIDFRLNEARTLPDAVERQMRSDKSSETRLKLVAFLAAIPILSNIATSSTQSHKMRVLEHGIWDKYITGKLPSNMIVYHWKRESLEAHKPAIQDFSAFVKMSMRQAGWETVAIYLGLAFLLALAGNFFAAYFLA